MCLVKDRRGNQITAPMWSLTDYYSGIPASLVVPGDYFCGDHEAPEMILPGTDVLFFGFRGFACGAASGAGFRPTRPDPGVNR